ncbi:MAG: carboxypeptidase-like regulatory domain-containing protein [Bacteroidota bacterium]
MPRLRWSGSLLLLGAVVCLVGACDAPRRNPLDPENPDTVLRTLRGTVRSDARAPLPLAGVAVLWESGGISTATDSAGRFALLTTSASGGWLRFLKTGYRPDSVMVQWTSAGAVTVDPLLDAEPSLDSLLLYTVVKNWYSQREYSLAVDVTVSDDDDIDSVWISQAHLSLRASLERISSSRFQGRFADYDLGLSSLEELIGRPVMITAADRAGRSSAVGSGFVLRVIREEIEPLSPRNQDTVVTASVELRWRRFEPGFRFSYLVEVYTDEPEPVQVWSRGGISSTEISVVVDPPIGVPAPENRYFWVVWCIDDFQNRSRSKPASFTLLPAETR